MLQSDFPYYNTIDQIYHTRWVTDKLARIERLRGIIADLWPAGHPTRFIHVAGTSGKGSVCKFLEAGFRTIGSAGSLTGPHLFDYCERFSIGTNDVTHADVTDAWENTVRPLSVAMARTTDKEGLGFGEVTMLIALVLFERYKLQWAAIEGFVGGRYDYPMALNVDATILTNVGNDHAHLLGQNKWQRTLDKAGISRKGIPLILGTSDLDVVSIVDSVCSHVGAELLPTRPQNTQYCDDYVRNHSQEMPSDALLHATHQVVNAATALTALQRLIPHPDVQKIIGTMASLTMPGRLQQIEEGIYIDVAHNPDKILRLVDEVKKRFVNRKKLFLVGLSKKRSGNEVLTPIMDIADTVIVSLPSHQGVDPMEVGKELASYNKGTRLEVIQNPQKAIAKLRHLRNHGDAIIITGSTYLIDDAINPDRLLQHIGASAGLRSTTV